MRYKNTILSLSLITTVGFAAWFTFTSYHQVAPLVSEAASLPDAYMENVEALILDKQGKPKMKVVTPKMVHYAENDTTKLTTPQLTLYRKSPQPWYVTSRYGKASQGIDKVDFWEDVVIHHSGDDRSPATVIKTIALTVYPNKQTAETSEFITMVQPNTIVKAVGMQADMNTGEIRLLSQARGEYVPSS